jgi:hypothetical protein
MKQVALLKRLEVMTVKERQHIYYHHSTEEDRSFTVNSVRHSWKYWENEQNDAWQ